MSHLPELPLEINCPNIGGIVFKSLGTIFCIAGILDRYTLEMGTYAFAFAVIADTIATPLTFAGASSYMEQRHSSGIMIFMTASWIIYSVQFSFGIGVLMVDIALGEEEDVPTGFIVFYLFLTIVGWISMLVHAERARGSKIFDCCVPIWTFMLVHAERARESLFLRVLTSIAHAGIAAVSTAILKIFDCCVLIFYTTASPPHEYSCITSTHGQSTSPIACITPTRGQSTIPIACINPTHGQSTIPIACITPTRGQSTIPIASFVASVIQTLPAGWEEATAENGRRYYYNIATSQTSWQAPTVQCPPPPPPLDECPRPPPRNSAASAPPTYSFIETSDDHGSGNNSLVGNGPANNSTVTKTYSNDGTVTVREERSYPDGSTTVSVTVTTRPNASDVSASV